MEDFDKQLINRLKRSEGQLRGVQRMINENKECVDIVIQLSAVRSSIDRAIGLITAENLKTTLVEPETDTKEEEKEEKLQQAINLIVKR
ncbi:MAG: metal-sensitive transcriptional regulator [Micrococcaceae bacterium]